MSNDREQHTINAAMNPDGVTATLFTEGIYSTHPSKTEFISLNIASEHVESVAGSLNFLAERLLDGYDVRPYQNAGSPTLPLALIPLDDATKRVLLGNFAANAHLDTNLILVAPCEMLPFTLPENLGMIDVVVGEKAHNIMTIRDKWPTSLIRHINGNTLDNRVINLTYVTFYDAFTHPEWEVDWVCDLEADEIEFVRENMALFAEIYRPSANL